MGISVVIPCFNEEKYIVDCLKSIIENGFDHSQLEVLLVDGGSTDNTLNFVADLQKEYSFLKLIHNHKQKTPFALNIGIKNALFDTIMIAGAHAIYPKNYLSDLERLLKNNDIDIIGGSITTCVKNLNPKTRAIQFVLTNKFGVGNSVFRIGAEKLIEVDTVPFGLYPQKIFREVGVYNEKLIRNHDIELSKRIKQNGYRIWLSPEHSVDYFARETFRALVKNNYGNGFWNAKTLLITKNISSLSIRHYIPLVFILSVFLPIVMAAFICPYAVLLSVFVLFSYFGLLLKVILDNKKHESFLYIIYTFIVLHFSYGFGTLMGFVNSLAFWRK